jgi:hypothetical protein
MLAALGSVALVTVYLGPYVNGGHEMLVGSRSLNECLICFRISYGPSIWFASFWLGRSVF